MANQMIEKVEKGQTKLPTDYPHDRLIFPILEFILKIFIFSYA